MFNLGRTDFHKQNFSSYALEVQSNLSVAYTKQALDCGEIMFTAIGVLVDVCGIIKLLQAVCSGLMLTEEDGRTILTNRSRYTDPFFLYANQSIFCA